MSSLKEIKTRIASVRSTLQITSAMKMVAAAKLHRAQQAMSGMLPYQEKLQSLFDGLLRSEEVSARARAMQLLPAVDAEERRLEAASGKIVLVAFSSNASLCGGFNANALKNLQKARLQLIEEGVAEERIEVVTVGKRISDAARKQGFRPVTAFDGTETSHLVDRPSYADAARFASYLSGRFRSGEAARIVLLYNHYASNASQPSVSEAYLPFAQSGQASCPAPAAAEDLIIEPDSVSLMTDLVPKVLALKIYAVLLDAQAAEHAARTVAMQMATDNAQKLLEELTLMYNKSRQQKITNELLDLVGGMRQ